jgi:PAS domain S-box-containing protein
MTLSSDLVRSVLESAPDAMIIIDGTGTVLFANQRVEALFGYGPADVVSRPVEMLLPERFRERHVVHRGHYAGSGRVRPMGAGLDLFARRKDGTEFPVEISLSPVGERDQAMVAAAIRDVTDRSRVELDLREARMAAERANLSKSRFLTTASHDLRQPLQALSLLNGTLRRLVDNEDARDALDQQEQALGAMSRLLGALLDVSKLESGAVRPQIGDFSVAQLLEQLRREFTGLAANKGLELRVESADLHARSDPTLVAQAVKNLLANAIKYTSVGHVRLAAQLRGDKVRLEVHDTGRGIKEEHLPFIFDEFYQAGVPANASRDGYGLGLSIVQNVARLLQLSVEVRSRAGEGSVFSLELPGGGTASASAVPLAGTISPSTAQAGAGRHVLLVEDDPGVRNATRLFLRCEGYRVSTAASFEEAGQRLEQHSDIDLVVTDYHLGSGRTGIDVVAAARARFGADYRAILVTGDTTPAISALQRDAHLRITSKPINAHDLVELIQDLLGS